MGAIFGAFSPAGRSPITFYKGTSDLPPFGHMSPYANTSNPDRYPGITYRYYTKEVLYPFGFGLSYTSFSYKNMSTSQNVASCGEIRVTVSVENTGKVDSDEVVQCYIKQPDATVPVPKVRLGAFARVFVPKGETIDVTLSIPPKARSEMLADGANATGEDVYQADKYMVVQPGRVLVSCGGGQPDYYDGALTRTVDIVGQQTQLTSCPLV
jgi:beta-glucosidase